MIVKLQWGKLPWWPSLVLRNWHINMKSSNYPHLKVGLFVCVLIPISSFKFVLELTNWHTVGIGPGKSLVPNSRQAITRAHNYWRIHINGSNEFKQSKVPVLSYTTSYRCNLENIILHSWPPWWRHQMETFSALLALCVGNSPVTGEFPAQRPVTRSFDVSFDLCLNKRLSKQSWGRWSETP